MNNLTSIISNYVDTKKIKHVLDKTQSYVDQTKFVTSKNIFTAISFCLLSLIYLLAKSTPKKKKKLQKKKSHKNRDIGLSTSKPPSKKSHDEQIKSALNKYDSEYKEGVTRLVTNYNPELQDDVYQKNYYNEMLLKLLIELDGVDLTTIENPELKSELKSKRKTAIRSIQAELHKLDAL
ncbi:Snl1p SCDLUD_002470 [Saccharomycodes ludwigii]|uniref:Snl1p n=1 Tax=Saccharomycodes ludwigii TaxID=36035 RepID=UPI001E8718C5|nr:hypothetical protein SCDLUD_002470 [Saccharomycodes ludwigii]KAH3901005.1 hypothetical protein SCDLUD_002470 [Saccharomycodes ludwigii]